MTYLKNQCNALLSKNASAINAMALRLGKGDALQSAMVSTVLKADELLAALSVDEGERSTKAQDTIAASIASRTVARQKRAMALELGAAVSEAARLRTEVGRVRLVAAAAAARAAAGASQLQVHTAGATSAEAKLAQLTLALTNDEAVAAHERGASEEGAAEAEAVRRAVATDAAAAQQATQAATARLEAVAAARLVATSAAESAAASGAAHGARLKSLEQEWRVIDSKVNATAEVRYVRVRRLPLSPPSALTLLSPTPRPTSSGSQAMDREDEEADRVRSAIARAAAKEDGFASSEEVIKVCTELAATRAERNAAVDAVAAAAAAADADAAAAQPLLVAHAAATEELVTALAASRFVPSTAAQEEALRSAWKGAADVPQRPKQASWMEEGRKTAAEAARSAEARVDGPLLPTDVALGTLAEIAKLRTRAANVPSLPADWVKGRLEVQVVEKATSALEKAREALAAPTARATAAAEECEARAAQAEAQLKLEGGHPPYTAAGIKVERNRVMARYDEQWKEAEKAAEEEGKAALAAVRHHNQTGRASTGPPRGSR
jgi:hypothetical protein